MDGIALEIVNTRSEIHQVFLLLYLWLFQDVVCEDLEILVDVAVDFYGEVAGAVECERQRVALLLSLYSVGVRTNLETLDILSNALYLYFYFTFKLKLSHGCNLCIVLGIRHSVYLEGVGVDVFPFAVCDAGFYLEVFLEFDAGRSLGYYQTVIRRRMPFGCHR